MIANEGDWLPSAGHSIVEEKEYGLEIGGKIIDGKYIAPKMAPGIPHRPDPIRITQRQLRLALLDVGLLDKVEEAVLSSDKETQILWQFTIDMLRDDPLIRAISKIMKFGNSEMDGLFEGAAGK